MIKIKRSSESTYFVNFLNLVNNYYKFKKKLLTIINVFSSFNVTFI